MSDSKIQLLEKFIDYCSVKNKAISKNIANIGTENYKRQDVSFSDLFDDNLKNNLKIEKSRHIQISNADQLGSDIELLNDSKTEGTSEVNNVNLEKEMAELAKNTLDYRFAVRKISSHFKEIQSAIKGGSNQ